MCSTNATQEREKKKSISLECILGLNQSNNTHTHIIYPQKQNMCEPISCLTHGHLRADNEQKWKDFENATIAGMNRLEAMEKYCPDLPHCCIKMFLLKVEDSTIKKQLYYACTDRVPATTANLKFNPRALQDADEDDE